MTTYRVVVRTREPDTEVGKDIQSIIAIASRLSEINRGLAAIDADLINPIDLGNIPEVWILNLEDGAEPADLTHDDVKRWVLSQPGLAKLLSWQEVEAIAVEDIKNL